MSVDSDADVHHISLHSDWNTVDYRQIVTITGGL